MSLSSYYTDVDLYLKDVVQFLNEFNWIYTTSNTEFIVQQTLRQIPFEWIATIHSLSLDELNEIPFDYMKDSWPYSLLQFLKRLKKLKPSTLEDESIHSTEHTHIETKSFQGMKPKKIHEIQQLSKEIYRKCSHSLSDSSIFVDLGCGVGHLSQYLHRKFEYKILGIEADSERVKTANNVQETKYPESLSSVKFVQHFIESDSTSFIQSTLVREFDLNETQQIILTGLHACADLTVTSLNLFLRTANVKKLLIMPCCYHKMKFKENSTTEFENVPLSHRLESIQNVKHIINRPFLRLAGQQTASRWRKNTEVEHSEHGRNMFQRAVIQAVLQEDETIVRNKNATRQSEYSSDILSNYVLIDKNTKKEKSWSSNQKSTLIKLLNAYPNGSCLSEFLTCLQASIQSICENLVILDRILYVQEKAADLQLNVNVEVKKIVNEDVSPRCYVIIAEKN